jgi:hypothetical protein
MKALRIVLMVVLIVFAISSAGCMKTWIFDFTGSTSLSDWHISDWSGSYVRDGLGLRINNMGFVSPFAFTGDFTLTVEFTLDTAADRHVYIEIGFQDDIEAEYLSRFNHHFGGVGDTANEYYGISEFGPDTDPDWNYTVPNIHGAIPGIARNGANTYILKKTGTNVEIKLNGVELADITASYYEGAQSALFISSELYDGILYFEKIKVQYDGEMIPI